MLRLPERMGVRRLELFQRAPTLGGECYAVWALSRLMGGKAKAFQRAPTLGGECYDQVLVSVNANDEFRGFNGHPPLGVNATG